MKPQTAPPSARQPVGNKAKLKRRRLSLVPAGDAKTSLERWVPGWLRRAFLGLLGVVAFVAVWKYAQMSGWSQHGAIPDPFSVPHAFLLEWQRGRMLPAIESSLVHYGWGLAQGSLLGLLFGAACALSPLTRHFTAWLVRILRPIPPLAWVVFAIAWFQISHAGAAFVIAIGVFWVNYFATYSAVAGVEPKYYELAQSFCQHGILRRLFGITLPAAAPGILAGVRTGVGQAWMTLIAAELLGVPGMGQEMNAAAGVGAYDAVVVYMLVISAIYLLCDLVFLQFEKRALKWRPS